EEGNIEEAVHRALQILPRFADQFEVIVVDDGSKDRTPEMADRLAAAHPEVRVVHHPKNRGYGGALRSGIAAARHPWIFYTDGDNQFDLGEIALLLPLRHDLDIVTGYRLARRDPAYRKLNAWLFNTLVHALFRVHLRDIDCAFKLYRASIFDGMELRSTGAPIDLEILARARRNGARIGEIGVHHYPRLHGEQSGASIRVILRAFRELFHLWGELRR
ncbi:MAG: glycosyltransferase family 2 protein, partial [Candidatus Eisenbacteria bacterium]|nr:glycosyltransferase family 2 protein [Candidatus Eisenbacteria bacterium]